MTGLRVGGVLVSGVGGTGLRGRFGVYWSQGRW